MDGIIARYTRAQAIEDGVLIDVSKMAKEAGFVIPVAVTDAVWNEYIVPSDILRGPATATSRLFGGTPMPGVPQ